LAYVVYEAAPNTNTIIYGVFMSEYAAKRYKAKLLQVKPTYTIEVYRLLPEQNIEISPKLPF